MSLSNLDEEERARMAARSRADEWYVRLMSTLMTLLLVGGMGGAWWYESKPFSSTPEGVALRPSMEQLGALTGVGVSSEKAVVPKTSTPALTEREMTLEHYHTEAQALYDQGELREAGKLWHRSLELARQRVDRANEAGSLHNLGLVDEALGDYPAARVRYEASLQIAQAIGDRAQQASALTNLGNVDQRLGDYPAARASYEASIKIARDLGDRAREALVLTNLGLVEQSLGNYPAAHSRHLEALKIAQTIGDRGSQATVLNHLGVVEEALGDYTVARARHIEALKIAQAIGDRESQATAVNSLGVLEEDLGDYPAARALFETALEMALVIGDKTREAMALGNIGAVDARLGDYPAARARYESSLEIYNATGDIARQALILPNLGNIYAALGNYPAARAHYATALQIAQAIGDCERQATSLNHLGAVDQDLGDYPAARARYAAALQIAQAIGNRAVEAETLENLGDIDHAIGDYSAARARYKASQEGWAALEVPRKVQKVISKVARVALTEGDFDSVGAVFETASVLLRGRYQLLTGDAAAARRSFETSVAWAESSGDAEIRQAALIGRGLAAEALGDAAAAKKDFEAVTAELEAQRAALAPGERRQYFAGKVVDFSRLDPYEGLVRVSQRLDDPAQAVYWSEHTKARALLDAIALQPSGLKLPQALARAEAELSQRIGALTKQRELALEKHNRERLQAIEQELPPLRAQLADLIARLRRSHPEYAALRYPEPVAVADLRLGADEALLIYEVTEPATYAWLIRDGRVVQSLILPLTRQALTAEIEAYRDRFQQIAESGDSIDQQHTAMRGVDPQRGAQLYRRLVAEFVPQLKDTRRLIIVPDEALGLLPFESLVVDAPATITWTTTPYGPSPRGLTYLGERYRISYAQSATALMQARARAATPAAAGLLVVADPVFDRRDARLLDPPAATQVAQAPEPDSDQRRMMSAVQRFVGGDDATPLVRLVQTGRLSESLAPLAAPLTALVGPAAGEPAVRAALATPHRYLLFATHGLLDAELPYVLEPALALTLVGASARDPAADGFLTLTEVMSLDLPAELAVLSACRTGLGRRLSGEGVMGMGRAFQYAGTRQVLMSLWSVDEAATVYFTERLFTRLKEGAAVPQALEQARADLRAAGWSHPFYWAGFILVGA